MPHETSGIGCVEIGSSFEFLVQLFSGDSIIQLIVEPGELRIPPKLARDCQLQLAGQQQCRHERSNQVWFEKCVLVGVVRPWSGPW